MRYTRWLRSANGRFSTTAPTPHQLAADKAGAATIFSGIQPTGIPHLGNYLGAVQNWKRLQDMSDPQKTRLMFSIVDLHAITRPADRAAGELGRAKRDLLACLLAIGLDPERSTIFYQSTVPQHSELQWILSCTASMGYLGRMTQWKAKTQQPPEDGSEAESCPPAKPLLSQHNKLGLFSYPVLQAADMLVHRATHVPVGDDQRQHLEFARECVINFNHAYAAPVLVAPSTIVSGAKRVMSLRRPSAKMSKSDPDGLSRILLTDADGAITNKIASALTDSVRGPITYDPVGRPGVANLLAILSYVGGDEPGTARAPGEWAAELAASGASLGLLKTRVAEKLVAAIGPIRERYLCLRGRDTYLDEVLEKGTVEATMSAEATMRLVREVVGLGR